MRKLSSENREHSKRRSLDEQSRKERGSTRTQQSSTISIVLFEKLDLIYNGEATRAQLSQFDAAFHLCRKRKAGSFFTVFVDMRNVTTFDACALLHVAAQVDRLSTIPGVHVRGNYPVSIPALRVLKDAKFEDFMGTKPRLKGTSSPTTPTLKLLSEDCRLGSGPKRWLPLYDFLKAHGHGLTEDETESLYSAFGECIENVIQHAYIGRQPGRWYGLALRPMNDKPATVAVLDLGIGIPGSVRRQKLDIVLRNAGTIMTQVMTQFRSKFTIPDEDESHMLEAVIERLRHNDWLCVFLATLGIRTRTGSPERGTGLTGLRETVHETNRGALHVLSGDASVTWTPASEPQIAGMKRITGTVVCLEVGEQITLHREGSTNEE